MPGFSFVNIILRAPFPPSFFLFLLKFVGIGADDSWYFQYRTWPSESEFATYSRLFFPEDSFGRPMLYGSEGRRNKLPLDSYSFPAFEGAQAAIQDLTGLTAQIEKCDVFSGVVMPLCLLRSAGLLTIHPAN